MLPTIQWNLLTLEILMTAGLVCMILLDMFKAPSNKDVLGNITTIFLLGILGYWATQFGVTGTTFNGMFTMDRIAWFFKGFFITTMLFITTITRNFFSDSSERRNIFYLLLWLALIGMSFVASSSDFLLMFISIEILTISLYVMTAYLKTDKLSIEAGMKYLILGALSSGLFLYGISLAYGAIHSTNFATINDYVTSHGMNAFTLFAFVLIFSAVAFKIAAVPFHMWVPDVYQGAPLPVTALLSVGSKAAGFVLLIRLFFDVLAPWHPQWAIALGVLAAVSMTWGNLVAIFQTNIKRLFGYSSIAHAGYLLMGAAAGSTLGLNAISFYLSGYLFTNLAAFLVILLVLKHIANDSLDNFNGLYQRSPFLALTLTLALVSLAGVPPMVGFFGKFMLLTATVSSGLLWLALIAAANIVISLYYYLMVVRRIYVEQPKTTTPIDVPLSIQFAIVITLIAMIGFGLAQGLLVDLSTLN